MVVVGSEIEHKKSEFKAQLMQDSNLPISSNIIMAQQTPFDSSPIRLHFNEVVLEGSNEKLRDPRVGRGQYQQQSYHTSPSADDN